MKVIIPPNPLVWPRRLKSVFLAGSIEMGDAPQWQEEIITMLAGQDIVVLNPRRQFYEDVNLREQVEWELNAQEKADIIVMYLHPGTKSPISLMELGLFARTGKMIICCPEGFWRKGNVDIVCGRYGVPQVRTIEDLAQAIRDSI